MNERDRIRFTKQWRIRFGQCKSLAEVISTSCSSARLRYYATNPASKRGKAKPVESDYLFIIDNRKMSNSWLTEHMPHLPPTVVIDIARKLRREDGNR